MVSASVAGVNTPHKLSVWKKLHTLSLDIRRERASDDRALVKRSAAWSLVATK